MCVGEWYPRDGGEDREEVGGGGECGGGGGCGQVHAAVQGGGGAQGREETLGGKL